MDLFDLLPILVLFGINLIIISKRIGSLEIQVWIGFLLGAVILILRGPEYHQRAILVVSNEADVFLFLFGIFVLVTALEISGALDDFANYLMQKSSNDFSLLFFLIFGFGLVSAILLNDTIAILAPIVLISFSKKVEIDVKPFIIVIAISISFGSALLPTGNPQNFLLSLNGNVGFLYFLLIAVIPVSVALTTTYLYFKFIFRRKFSERAFPKIINYQRSHPELTTLRKRTVLILALTIPMMIFAPYLEISISIPLLLGASVLLFISQERNLIIEKLDWSIMILFAGMFVVIDAVVEIKIIHEFILSMVNKPLTSTNLIVYLLFLFGLSQVISNVPVAILISNVLVGSSFDHPIIWVMTAIVTTFAGATSMMGAASNFIVVETARKRDIHISWWDFTKIGLPLSIICLVEVLILSILFIRFV